MHNPAVAEGTVAELLPTAHRAVVISYEIKGRTYRSSTSLPESAGCLGLMISVRETEFGLSTIHDIRAMAFPAIPRNCCLRPLRISG